MFSQDRITIWAIDLQLADAELHPLELLLADDEKVRADRYKFDLHRRRFVIARANLRIILSNYLNLAPQEIEFSYSSKGKPFLANYPHLEFNLSHSQDLAVCALTENSAVGIDLECEETMSPKLIDRIRRLSKRFLTREESQIIQGSDSEQTKFLQIWTLKEAYLKATGCGLGKLVEVSTIWDNEEIIGLAVNHIPLDWMIYPFSYSHYIGAVVSPIHKAIALQSITS